jgi:hypothetical protein
MIGLCCRDMVGGREERREKKRADLLVVAGDGRIFGGWKNAGPVGAWPPLSFGALLPCEAGADSTSTSNKHVMSTLLLLVGTNSGWRLEWLKPGGAWRSSAPGPDFAWLARS